MLWEKLREEEFEAAVEASKGLCIIPMGCVEAHGQHLPLGCDVFIAKTFAERATEIEPAVVFPAMYFGEKSGAGEFKGTIIFPQHLVEDILLQCCKEISRNGFKKILILNAHGGNASLLGNLTRGSLQYNYDFNLYSTNVQLLGPRHILENIEEFPYLTEEDIKIIEDYKDKVARGGHGCFIETSCIYDPYPELVRLDRFSEVDGESTHRFDEFSKHGISTPFAWMGNYPNSLTAARHDGLNERIAKAFTTCITNSLVKSVKFLKEETISTEYKKEWLAKNPNLPKQ